MFPQHNPAQQTFNWYCELSGATDADQTSAAEALRDHVRKIRHLYQLPFGRQLPYDDQFFRMAYLLAYFPYYIEPLYHTLQTADLPDELFGNGILKSAFFGGGPCPEVLGLAGFLRDRGTAKGT